MAKRFREARGSRKGVEIEALSGISNTTIGKCENAQQTPSLELLAYYSLKEGIPMDRIVFGYSPQENNFAVLRLQCLELPPAERLALARELLADLGSPDGQ